MENPLDSIEKLDTSIRSLLVNLPVPVILKFKDAVLKLHNRQLQLINDILKEKGHIDE